MLRGFCCGQGLVSVLVAVPVAGQDGFMQLRSGWQTEDGQQIKGEIMEAQVGGEGYDTRRKSISLSVE